MTFIIMDMTIENIEVLRGPSVWSDTRQKLIQMRLNLHELEQRPTNTISGFFERLQSLLPTLYSHRCSPGVPGGFFERVKEGTWMGHVVEHIALEIQTLAGFDTGFGRTRETETPGTYNVVFSFKNEAVGVYAATAAVNLAEALIAGRKYPLHLYLEEMRIIGEVND
jgi:cyanophycin synthetase